MPKQETLSLPAAIFININIMLGSGVFINTVILAQKVGGWGFALYLLSGVLMLPLIWGIAHLSSLYTEGTFYTFGALIHPYWGFISTWSYFIGKLSSASLAIHVFNTFLQHICPYLATVPIMGLDLGLVTLFVALNMLNVQTGSKVQYAFVFTKFIPLLFAITSGLLYFSSISISAPHIIWHDLSAALPLTLFCCLGFEATCSLSSIIKDSKRNAPRAILISFAIVIALCALYQLAFYGSLGTILAQQENYTGAFPVLVELVAPTALRILNPLFSTAIALSALGGAYGIMFSNLWNLHTLAQHSQIFCAKTFTKRNSFNVPTACVIAEGVICALYLLLSNGAQIPLQYTATLACISAYAISIAGLLTRRISPISILASLSCLLLLAASFNGFIKTSLVPLYVFGGILLVGTAMFFIIESSKSSVQ